MELEFIAAKIGIVGSRLEMATTRPQGTPDYSEKHKWSYDTVKRKSKQQPEVQSERRDLQDEAEASATEAAAESKHPDDTQEAVAPAPSGDLEVVQNELSKTLAELEDWRDKCLRAQAETENTRRRAEKEITNSRKYAVERFATEMLAVRDSLELARNVDLDQEDATAVEKMLEGVNLTLKQIDAVFDRFAIKEVAPAIGDKLDPERHQAMSVQESTEISPNHIVTVIQKGYTLQDRLIRPAMVIVAKAAAPEAEPVSTRESLEKTE